jgi:hypothetical protein
MYLMEDLLKTFCPQHTILWRGLKLIIEITPTYSLAGSIILIDEPRMSTLFFSLVMFVVNVLSSASPSLPKMINVRENGNYHICFSQMKQDAAASSLWNLSWHRFCHRDLGGYDLSLLSSSLWHVCYALHCHLSKTCSTTLQAKEMCS